MAQIVNAGIGITVQRQRSEPLAQRGLQLGRQGVRVLHRVQLDHAARILDGVAVHGDDVLADAALDQVLQGGVRWVHAGDGVRRLIGF